MAEPVKDVSSTSIAALFSLQLAAEKVLALRVRLPESAPITSVVDDLSVDWLSANLPTSQISSVAELATKVFDDAEVAKEWLREPNMATDNKPPISLLGTESGFDRVEALLHRIEYGVLA